MLLDTDYKFRDDLKYDTVPIELLTDKFEGIVYRYTVVKVEEKDGTAKMIFDYDIINPAKFTVKGLKKDKQFQKHIGLILNDMLLITHDILNIDKEPEPTEYYEEP
jgi:hypothetical protein